MYTGQQHTVSSFLTEYFEQTDVAIVTEKQYLDTNNGNNYLLVFGQGLRFGNQMKTFLINPNQCRAFGFIICDDTTNN